MTNADDNSVKEARNRLLEALERLKTSGNSNFSVGGQASNLPAVPGLSIAGYGLVPFPITAPVAKGLKEHGRKAPFGKGQATVVDESVRKAWEFDASQITVAHPDWPDQLQKLVNQVAEGLDCGGRVRPILYKGLLYEKGGHFAFHKDTEKEKKMFATLVIQFPSICSGGTLVTRHDGREQAFDFGQESKTAQFSMHYAAHYADVEHSLQAVTSGNRFVLTYSLCWESGLETVPSAMTASLNAAHFRTALLDFLNLKKKSMVGILLDHEYTSKIAGKSGMGLCSTKGNDRKVYDALRVANQHLELNFQIQMLMVQLTQTVSYYAELGCSRKRGRWSSGSGNEDWYDWCEHDASETITNWIDERGNKVDYGRHLGFSFDDIICYKEDYEDVVEVIDWGDMAEKNVVHYNRSGPQKEETYRKYAMVVYTKDVHVLKARKCNSS